MTDFTETEKLINPLFIATDSVKRELNRLHDLLTRSQAEREACYEELCKARRSVSEGRIGELIREGLVKRDESMEDAIRRLDRENKVLVEKYNASQNQYADLHNRINEALK